MINRLLNFISSMKFAAFLLLAFAFSIGYATFIENDFGTRTAKALIFNSWWLEVILILLSIILLLNIVRMKMFRRKKLTILIYHLAFIIIILGAGITRYFGTEGMMHIREGNIENRYVSDDLYLQIKIDNKKLQYEYDKRLYLSAISSNKFAIPIRFLENDITIKYTDFIPNVKDSLFDNILNGTKMVHLVIPNNGNMKSVFLSDGEEKIIANYLFTLNRPKEKAINLFLNDSLSIVSDIDIESMSMLDRGTKILKKQKENRLTKRKLYSFGDLQFVVKGIHQKAVVKSISKSQKIVNGNEDELVVNINCNGENKQLSLIGGSGFVSPKSIFTLAGLDFTLSYGAKYLQTPFYIELEDFQLERYPGSMSASSFASQVKVIDGNRVQNYRIFMNNVLNYEGYRFFQSSYDKDEKGTILSVKNDWWGTFITYLGYSFLFLGIILTMFSTNTRFYTLTRKLKRLKMLPILLLLNISSFSSYAYNSKTNLDSLIKVNLIDAEHAKKADYLLIQDNRGRIKPLNTISSEFIRKISRKKRLYNQSPTQILLGMMSNPVAWGRIPVIKISNPELAQIMNVSGNSLAFIDLFDKNGEYKLKESVEDAYKKNPQDRNNFDQDVISVDERLNLCYLIFNGDLLRFFPLKDDLNHTWYTTSKSDLFSGNDSLFVSNIMKMYFSAINSAKNSGDWNEANEFLVYIQKFQEKYGHKVIPKSYKTDLEIKYNNTHVFNKLFMIYSILGGCLLILLIIQIFNNYRWLSPSVIVIKYLIYIGFVSHTIGLVVRWIISEHAPWSNAYESIIYIAWATLLSGVLFSKKSPLTLVATCIVSSLLLMVAHLNWLDPEITNLVPVLKSYWLMIHVAIITASYGFLSLGAMLGLFVLWIMIISTKSNIKKLESISEELSIINEKSLIIGLFALTIGTFLGGIWANESWGRYWGWDPKETWALVSILVYAFILHMRFIPVLQGRFIFNLASVLGIWSIIMTYFGVNYYLSGLHSYAAGDPIPIPNFVYYLIGITFISTILAYMNYKKIYK